MLETSNSPPSSIAEQIPDIAATKPTEMTADDTDQVAAEGAAAASEVTDAEDVSENDDEAGEEAAGEGEESDDDEEDEDETVECSPDSRWMKRRDKIKYRDVPGVDNSFLAMDSELGFEVVWNEANISANKKFGQSFQFHEEKLKTVFGVLTTLEHPNIVSFHDYWIDKEEDRKKNDKKKTDDKKKSGKQKKKAKKDVDLPSRVGKSPF